MFFGEWDSRPPDPEPVYSWTAPIIDTMTLMVVMPSLRAPAPRDYVGNCTDQAAPHRLPFKLCSAGIGRIREAQQMTQPAACLPGPTTAEQGEVQDEGDLDVRK